LCKQCYLRAKKKDVNGYRYVCCRGCGCSEYLEIGVKVVVGVIGQDEYRRENERVYVPLWDQKIKKVRNADIDELLILNNRTDNENYEKVIEKVILTLINDFSRENGWLKRVPVIIEENVNLSELVFSLLENEFGEIKVA
jgi:hypothetical protein